MLISDGDDNIGAVGRADQRHRPPAAQALYVRAGHRHRRRFPFELSPRGEVHQLRASGSGERLRSKAQATTLRELARRTGARFFRGEDDRQVQAAIDEILSSGRPVAGYQAYPIRRDLYFYFFAAAFVCMLAATSCRRDRRGWPLWNGRRSTRSRTSGRGKSFTASRSRSARSSSARTTSSARCLIGLFGRIPYSFKKGEGEMAGSGPPAARRAAGPGQDAAGLGHRQRPFAPSSSASSSRPTCCPPTSSGTRVFDARAGGVPHREGAALRQHRPGGRNQPRAAENPERAARSDAGAPGHHWRAHVPPRRSVLGAGDAESHRAGRRFALPEAQLDRFAMMLRVQYPTAEHEVQMLRTRLEELTHRPRGRPADHRAHPATRQPGSCGRQDPPVHRRHRPGDAQ